MGHRRSFGRAAGGLEGVDCRLTVLEAGPDRAKVNVVNRLSTDRTASMATGATMR